MDLKQDAPIIHYWHYKNWRQTGNAYEQRFSSHIVPNRTMGSYIPGRSVTACIVCVVILWFVEKDKG